MNSSLKMLLLYFINTITVNPIGSDFIVTDIDEEYITTDDGERFVDDF